MKKFSEFQDQVIETQDQKRIFGDLLCNLKDSSLYYTDTLAGFTLPKLKMDEILKPNSAIVIPHSLKKKSFKILENGKKISRNFSNQVQKLAKKPLKSAVKSAIARNLAVWDSKEGEKKRKLKASRGAEYLKEEESVRKPKLPRVGKVKMDILGPGASYNPQKEDHQELIQEAYKEELDKIEKKEKILKKLEYSKELDDLSDDMTKELAEESESSEEEASKVLVRKRKTKSERNKRKKLDEKRKNQEKENQEKKILKDINKIQEIENDLSRENVKLKKFRDITKVNLGPLKFRKESMELQLSDEISDNLRKFKPEGNLFKDRFKALQKNQMIETRLPISVKAAKRKYKLKETESHDYKRFK
jgi:nucleolar protein 53